MITLAVVGLGTWDQRHVRSARASGRFDLTVAVDPNVKRAGPVAEELGLELRPTLEDALSDPALQAISLATPHTQHTGQIIDAAAAGKHVYTEKPFALNAGDARKAVTMVEKAGVELALGHDQRFYPVMAELKELIKEETLGPILHVETTLIHDSLLMPYRKLYGDGGADYVNEYSRGWRLDAREVPAGPISQFGLHRIDALIQLMGEIEWVFAAGSANAVSPDLTDTVVISLGFKNGATGVISNSIAAPLASRLQIYGTERWAASKGPETFVDYRECSLVDLTVFKEGERQHQRFDIIDSVAANFTNFADAIEDRDNYLIPLSEMIHTIAVVDAVRDSLATRQRVTVAGA